MSEKNPSNFRRIEIVIDSCAECKSCVETYMHTETSGGWEYDTDYIICTEHKASNFFGFKILPFDIHHYICNKFDKRKKEDEKKPDHRG